MSLVKSISGIRGTIGGRVGDGLNPVDIVRFTAAYATQRRAALLRNAVQPCPAITRLWLAVMPV